MDRRVRIGVAGLADPRLHEALRALPTRPEVQVLPDLYGGIELLLQQPADVLFLAAEADSARQAGALRLFRGVQPTTAVVLVAPLAREIELAPLIEQTGARLLMLPLQPGAVAAVLEQALSGSDRPREEQFLDLARGFADEVNNPLLFLTGHLQLLQSGFEVGAERDRRDQVAAALAGAQRVQGLVDRIQQIARAAGGPRRSEPLDLAAAMQTEIARLPSLPAALHLLLEPETARFQVLADPDLLAPALTLFVQVAGELLQLRCSAQLSLTRLQGAVRVRLQLAGPGVAGWRLPRTFEPYYLNRTLRGTSHGLSLLLVQTAVHAHGGQATARRLPDESLAIDLTLPAD
jgi:nitrogen-specific signal transduction histidine kinase